MRKNAQRDPEKPSTAQTQKPTNKRHFTYITTRAIFAYSVEKVEKRIEGQEL